MTNPADITPVLTDSERYQIYEYLPLVDAPEDQIPSTINYKAGLTVHLVSEQTQVHKGELRQVVWKSPDGTPVLQIDIIYDRDILGTVIRQLTTRRWFKRDGSLGTESKEKTKTYTPEAAIRESRRRRQNVKDSLSKEILGMLIAAYPNLGPIVAMGQGQAFLDQHSIDFDQYINNGSMNILSNMDSSRDALLALPHPAGGTVLDRIIDQLTWTEN